MSLFKGDENDFLQNDENVEILCRCIRSQDNLQYVYMEDIEVNDNTALKIIDAY